MRFEMPGSIWGLTSACGFRLFVLDIAIMGTGTSDRVQVLDMDRQTLAKCPTLECRMHIVLKDDLSYPRPPLKFRP